MLYHFSSLQTFTYWSVDISTTSTIFEVWYTDKNYASSWSIQLLHRANVHIYCSVYNEHNTSTNKKRNQ